MSHWKIRESDGLAADHLPLLFANKIGLLRIKNFLSEAECRQMESDIYKARFEYYEQFPNLGKIGVAHYEHIGKDKSEYFNKIPGIMEKINQITLHKEILLRLKNMFLKAGYTSVDHAYEGEMGRYYFAGLIRMVDSLLLHRDYAKSEGKGWEIELVEDQLACNLFITTSMNGGEGQVFNEPWTEEFEKYKIPDSYGYDEMLVKDTVESIVYQPEKGELVLLNSRNFHKVHPISGKEDRIALSSFIGRTSDNKIIFWS